jgi:hypothetical protein
VRHEGEGGRDNVIIETFLVCWRSTGGCNATRPRKELGFEGDYPRASCADDAQ